MSVAAAWTIIGHRIRITQAAAVKARMAKELAGRKPEWLRSVAHRPGPLTPGALSWG